VINRLLKKNKEFWTQDHSLTALLIYLVVAVFVLLPFRLSQVGEVVNGIIFSLMLVSGVFSVVDRAHVRIPLIALAVATFIVHWFHLLHESLYVETSDAALTLIFLATLSFLVLYRIFAEGDVSFHRIQGAIAVYVLIGWICSEAYHLMYIFDNSAFIWPTYQATDEAFHVRFHYFSYATLTTIGYGDIMPYSAMAKSLVMVEGLIGQLFPAIMITRLVSLEIESRKNRPL
jgi:Ion channel